MSNLPGSHTVFEASGFVTQCFDQVTFGLGGMDQKPCKSFDLGLEMINGQSDVDIAEVDREIEVTRLVGPFSGFHSWLRVWVLNYHVRTQTKRWPRLRRLQLLLFRHNLEVVVVWTPAMTTEARGDHYVL